MPTLLIVDDETVFRRGLEHMLSDLSPDWSVVHTAKDGVEALEWLETCRPDVIITDIRMPRMDGIQLQSIVREKYPQIRCIVMSGYNDFAYARESLKMGARDYLMKPPEREELYAALAAIKEEWQADQAREQEHAKEDQEEKRMRQQLRQHILASLISGTVQEEELELLDGVGLVFPYPLYTCCVVHLDRESVTDGRYSLADPSLFALFIAQFVQELIPDRVRGYVFIAAETKVVALLNHDKEGDEVVRLAKRVCHQIRTLSNLTVTIGVGSPAGDLEAAARSFGEADMALLYRLVHGGDRVLTYEETMRVTSRRFEGHGSDWRLLDQSVREGRIRDSKAAAGLWLQELMDSTADPGMIQGQICKMVLHFYETAVQLDRAKDWLGTRDVKQVLSELISISSRTELTAACEELIGRLAGVLSARRGGASASPVEAVVQYIHEHYATPITLSGVAEKVYLNPSYLSTLFKSRLGTSFIEYVTAKRVDEAKKRLLYSDDKIAAISEASGFSNIRHFNRVFKSATGHTPLEFRREHRTPAGDR
ncbi:MULTISPECIES: response regulator [Paenibacillus]|uniref:response regulator n=1 Tax=Paenibacillus TaxID=44249 RepID=UPI0022B90079|nr:response regulator [Paenibacillus caseinilyticus]MCZ8520389.1 response regulator [Paenibacillus caseinilyticus]